MSTKTATVGIGLALVAVIAVIALVGDDGDGETSTGTDTDTDAAFVTEMTPHHESAIEMAEIAQERAEHPEIKQLADDIIATQSSEIETLAAIDERVGGEGEDASLGLSSEAMGMTTETGMLETAEPFDRAFIDMMVPHHQGAIVMARIELEEGADEEAKALADEIIAAQSSEIEQMNEWRTEWYGEPSPAGGVPEPGETGSASHDSMSGMEH